MTLIEILVAGALFGLFTGMVAVALVLANRTQRESEAKLDAVRKGSIALDQLVREIEGARFNTRVQMGGTTALTATPETPTNGYRLEISRRHLNPAATGPNAESQTIGVVAKYWFEEEDPLVPDDGTLRRTLHQDTTGDPLLAGEVAAGRVLMGNLRNFQVSADTTPTGLTFIKAELFANTVGVPITTSVTTEAPDPPPPP